MNASSDSPIRMLVVCLGNICRSPAAEAALREAAARQGIAVEVDSAGTGPWHVGEPPHPQIRAAGQRAALSIDGQGRQVTGSADLEGWDLILAMDRSNLRQLTAMAPDLAGRMHLFRNFDPDTDNDEVPDPYGLADRAYDETVKAVRSGARAIMEAITEGRLP